jgi:hypothetical protein
MSIIFRKSIVQRQQKQIKALRRCQTYACRNCRYAILMATSVSGVLLSSSLITRFTLGQTWHKLKNFNIYLVVGRVNP